MLYTITKKLYKNNLFYGYRVTNGKYTINCDIDDIDNLRQYGMLQEIDDLDNLPIENIQISKTRHQRAKEYLNKLKLLGGSLEVDFRLIDNDRVVLTRINSPTKLSKFTVPSFVTDFMFDKHFNIIGTEIEEIYIDNDPNTLLDISILFTDLEQLKITVEFRHPEMIFNASKLFLNCENIREIVLKNFNTPNLISTRHMFSNCNNLKTLVIENIDTSNVRNMESMFCNCTSLVDIPFIKNFNTSKVTSMKEMFNRCKSIQELDLSSFNTSNVYDMTAMFGLCDSITKLDLSSFNTSNVTSMEFMFDGCLQLKEINLESFDTSNVESMIYMFADCKSLEQLDIRGFSSKSLERASCMFGYSNIRELNLGWLDLSKDIDITNIFNQTSNIHCLDLSNLKLDNLDSKSKAIVKCNITILFYYENSIDKVILNKQNIADLLTEIENIANRYKIQIEYV